MGIFDTLKRLFGGGAETPATADDDADDELFVFVKIPEALGPVERGDKYEDPLGAALEEAGVGEVTGGGCALSEPDDDGARQVAWCGLDVELVAAPGAMDALRRELHVLGAPAETVLEFERDGELVKETLGAA